MPLDGPFSKMLERANINKIIEKRKLRYLLNNHKWKKLFKCFSAYDETVVGLGKLLNAEVGIPFCLTGMTEYLDYYNSSIEKMGGHYAFSQIEYIEVPSHWKTTKHGYDFITQQNISRMLFEINRIGQYFTKIDEEKLVIYGYI